MSSLKEKLNRMDELCHRFECKTRDIRREMKEILSISGDVDIDIMKKEFYGGIGVEYIDNPARVLKLFIPRKMVTLKKYRAMHSCSLKEFSRIHASERNNWKMLIQCAMGKAKDLGLFGEWVPLKNFVTIITPLGFDNKTHDVDNFTIGFIHNALKDAAVIVDDRYSCMRYFVQGVYVSYKSRKIGTGITVLDTQDDDICFHNWKLSELAKPENSWV